MQRSGNTAFGIDDKLKGQFYMKISELIQEREFSELREEIFKFTKDMLAEYFDNVSDAGSKEIFDAVWGPVEFNSAEIAILDSPLLQRLRRIKQLGLASYVYCDADYSRFSHTIGVFYLAARMADIISKKKKSERFNFVQIAKLAALFHDTGHMYFSHVSEYFFLEYESFNRYEEIKAAISRFKEAIDKNVALHEMISVIIVQSPETRNLLKKIATWMDGINIRNDDDLDDLVEYISCMIAGVANDEEMLPYYQIINGSVDADKCDYLSRDSHATNVPVAVDIERLVHKLTVEEDTAHGQKSQIWNGDETKKVYYLPAIKESAEEAFNQLLMARTIMFKSVYYHQKVRTAEVMLRNIFADLNRIGVNETQDFYHILMTTDDFFGANCYELLKKIPDGSPEEDREKIEKYNEELKSITKRLNALNNRCLLKRSCAISSETIIADKHHQYTFEREILKLSNRKLLQSLEEKVQAEYFNICRILNIKDNVKTVFLIVEYPKYSPDHSKLDTRISYGNGQSQKASEVFQSETWMGSRDSRHKDCYLVTDGQYREVAFLALQKVLYDEYHVILTERASVYSKVSYKEIQKRQDGLWRKNYYNMSMELIADFLLEKHQSDIADAVKKFHTYEGRNGNTIDTERVKSYLKQYMKCEFSDHREAELLIDGVLKMLKKALFITRAVFDDVIRKLLAEIREDAEQLYICPMGGIKDSAKHMTYYFNDLKNEVNPMRIKSSLQEILKEEQQNKVVVFFDDGAYSGKQAVSIFQEYMNVPVNQRATREIHVDVLTKEEQEILKRQKIILMYVCFNRLNEEDILNELQKLGLENVDIKYGNDMAEKIFSDESEVFADVEQKQIVKKYLSEIGKEILTTAKSDTDGKLKENWSEERIDGSILGYNDAQQMVVLKSNVPTYTITSVWLAGGTYKGREWKPLFDRTEKT